MPTSSIRIRTPFRTLRAEVREGRIKFGMKTSDRLSFMQTWPIERVRNYCAKAYWTLTEYDSNKKEINGNSQH